MGLAVFALGGFVLSCAVVRWLRGRGAIAPDAADAGAADLFEGAAATAIVTFGVWVATSWALALTGHLTAAALAAAGALELAAGGAALVRQGVDLREYAMPRTAVLVASGFALLPAVLWTAFVFWRGTVLPVYNHDALAYHLPKAVLLARAGGYQAFDVPEPRIATWPCDYELLLADTIALTGGDAWTASVGTLAYVVFTLETAWVAAAWWGAGVHVAIAAAAAATAPLVVLHSGLHKNDLLLSAFAVGAFVWAGRWSARGCRVSLLLATVALILAAGTKASAAFVVLPTLVLVVRGAVRHARGWTWRQAGAFAIGAAAASMLLGGAVYASNLAVRHRLIAAAAYQAGYGDWSSIWMFSTMLVMAPFSTAPNAVWNPFRGEFWWWPANDIWMSHFGALFSVLVVALAPCAWRYGRQGRGGAAVDERAGASLVALAAYIATLPIQGRPFGFFAGEGRYVFFVVPFVFAWTLCPLTIEILGRAGRARAALEVIAGLAIAALGARSVAEFGVHDAYAPFEWIVDVVQHPEDRRPFVRRDRAASAFDILAGANDVCAIDVGYDTWVYPAYGRDLTRKVEFLKPAPGGDVVVPDDAQWVLVDRSWNVFFGHPKFVDMGKAAQYLGRGSPSGDDLRVYRQLRSDPRFELVYDKRDYNQAVFRRRPTASAGSDADR
jgi:hypothetical protein